MRGAIALLAGVLAVAALTAGPAAPSADRETKCRATLVYRGVTYYGLEASHLSLRAGRAVGVGREPDCKDPSKTKFRRVAVRRVAGVRPRVAIARRAPPNIIYIAADRCRGNLGPARLVRCLKRSR